MVQFNMWTLRLLGWAALANAILQVVNGKLAFAAVAVGMAGLALSIGYRVERVFGIRLPWVRRLPSDDD
ncbi:hypothetical protein [Phenylobacterium sp. J367]|uniref:hypothetical protein n=1 Tax=Phenylobacterium sp. J367 TaxID=2898435 RepID=UPI0021515DAF|nr:hypothetical protein [Phenylobacterium sp. J367]MCR5878211.1 hypothetical protein [Phenylobacterium sp. J367]